MVRGTGARREGSATEPQKQQLQSVWEKCDNQRAFRAQSSPGLGSNEEEEEAGAGVKGRSSLLWLANE